MRILMVNKYVHVTGGADRQCMSLAAALRRAGHEVAFLAMSSADDIEQEGVFVPMPVTHETRDDLAVAARVRVLRDAFWNGSAADAMRTLIANFRPHVVHAHRLYPQLSVSSIIVARRAGLPIVQTLHDYEFLSANPFDARGGKVDRTESRLSYRALNTAMFLVRRRVHARAVREWIAVSDFVARTHAARGIRATVIPNFADIDGREGLRSPEERDGVLFLGALSLEKGALDVLELARRIPDVPVVIAGRGPLRLQVADESKDLPNVRFEGYLDPEAAARATRSARVVVIPSRWQEPGSLVSLESMAAGTPVVAYRSGGLAEYVETSGAGLTVQPHPSDLAAGVRKLLDDSSLWWKCASAGIEASRTTFSRDTHTKSVLEVYERARAPR
jgi:glycosyltransferase involved in cell wall biosynthesis